MEISQEQLDKLGAIIDAKHRFAYRMAELLRGVEWSDGHWSVNMGGGGCPVCSNECSVGHAADCELATLLREWDESGRT